MECPQCGSFGPLKIFATQSGMVHVSDDGTDFIEGNVEWEEDGACECTACRFTGVVADFRALDRFQRIVLDAYQDGEHANLRPSEIGSSGDTLLKFLLIDISEREDCDSFEEAVYRLDAAIKDLTEVRARFEAKL